MNTEPESTLGWTIAGPAPDRSDVLAAAGLADVRRILAIDVTHRTIIPAHEWAVRDSAPVRLEIHAGTSLADVTRSLEWLLGALPKVWDYLTVDELGAAAVAKEFQRADLRNRTIDGRPFEFQTPQCPTPGEAGAKVDDGSNGV